MSALTFGLGSTGDPASVGSTPVSVLVADEVERVTPATTLREVAAILVASGIGAVPVADGGDVTGVVSERDLVHAIADGLDPATTTAQEVASTGVLWCDISATVGEVATEMMEHFVRHVLVEENGRLAGIVSARDLLGAYASADDNP